MSPRSTITYGHPPNPPSRSGKRRLLTVTTLLAMFIIGAPISARALELWSDEDSGRRADLRTTLKLTAFAAFNPGDPRLFPNRRTVTGMARTRFGVDFVLGDKTTAELAYEHHARRTSHGGAAGLGGAILSDFAPAPWRIAPLNWQIVRDEDNFDYRHEIDRALVKIQPDWGVITIGRQAIGYGRGVLFSAVDLFAPFSPVEVDREWRRGVDALRFEYRTTPLSSLEFTAVFGDRWDDSALLARFRGYLGEIDGEFLLGKRGEDTMFGAAMSAALGGAAVHGEAALFNTPERQLDGGLFGKDDLVAKLVLGSSYTLNVGNGLTVLGEYHYSGFGMKRVEDAILYARKETYINRYLRGDSQILGRQAMALQGLYPVNMELTATLLLLGSPRDLSGLVSPSLVWSASQTTTVMVSAFLPWGERPRRGMLRSEYGATPVSLFAQLNMYF